MIQVEMDVNNMLSIEFRVMVSRENISVVTALLFQKADGGSSFSLPIAYIWTKEYPQ